MNRYKVTLSFDAPSDAQALRIRDVLAGHADDWAYDVEYHNPYRQDDNGEFATEVLP